MIINQLKERRIDARFSQQDLADALEISRPTYRSWESGQSYPNIKQCFQILDFYRQHRFDFSILDLFDQKQNKLPKKDKKTLRL